MNKLVYIIVGFLFLVGCASNKKLDNQTSKDKSWRDDVNKNVPKREVYEYKPNSQGAIPAEVPQMKKQLNTEREPEME
jgi:hypothetical protein